ncbi:MAG: prepilin peptidase [Rickettsiales bacterium]
MIATVFIVLLAIFMLAVILFDAARYIIPNNLNLAVLILYFIAVFVLPIPPGVALSALGAASAVLLVGLGMFALGLMGGGDVKLLAVLALWTGWSMATVNFLVLTALFGGALVVVVLLARAILPPILFKLRPTMNMPRLLVRKQPVPYGLAIAGGFSYLLATHGVPGL